MSWWAKVTGQSEIAAASASRDIYRKNKAALGGATMTQPVLDAAADAGVLGRDSDGNIVRRRPSSGSPRGRSHGDGSSGRAGAGAGPGNAVAYTERPVSGSGPGNVAAVAQSSVKVKDLPPIQLPVDDFMAVTPLVMGGQEQPIDPGWSDAQAFEQRYGDGDLLSPNFFNQWGVWGADQFKPIGDSGFFDPLVELDTQFSEWLSQSLMGKPLDQVSPFWDEVPWSNKNGH